MGAPDFFGGLVVGVSVSDVSFEAEAKVSEDLIWNSIELCRLGLPSALQSSRNHLNLKVDVLENNFPKKFKT